MQRRFVTKRGSRRFRERDFERVSLKPAPMHRHRERLARVMRISFDLGSLQSGRDDWSLRLVDPFLDPMHRAELRRERALALKIAREAQGRPQKLRPLLPDGS